MTNRRKRTGRITAGGNVPRPGQKGPATIVLTQPKRFGIDITDYMAAVRAFENVDFSRRYKLYDLYSDILMDTHLTSVIEKRRNAALSAAIEFRRDGKPDEEINRQIRSPWFRKLVGDILDAKYWGFSLMQFYREGEWVNYDLVPRKHADPVRKMILRHQTDLTGTPWEEYPDLLFVGSPDDPGLLAKAAVWVIYKRNDVADWAQFAEVFGAPIREYTYPTDDDEARMRALADAESTGSMAVFVHAQETVMELREASNKTGSSDLYDKLYERCNRELSKLILCNTLTTEESDKGTQALGTVHMEVEEMVKLSDRQDILDVLNYDMADIFAMLGINTDGGEFCYPEKKLIEPGKKVDILTKLHTNFNLPVGDDYLYQEFGIEKPADYREQKKRQEEKAAEMEAAKAKAKKDLPEDDDLILDEKDNKDNRSKPSQKSFKQKENALRSIYNRLKRFFGKAPQRNGAALEW